MTATWCSPWTAGTCASSRPWPGPTRSGCRVRLLRSFDPTAPEGAEVADPYFGDAGDFADVLDQVERACRGLLDAVARVLPDRV